jgi:hypothetical protein
MANPVTTLDIANRWRPLSTDETITAQAHLDDVWALANLKIPGLSTRVDAAEIDLGLVRMVLCNAVLRVLKNPDGKSQEALEDYSYTMSDAAAAGALYLSDTELDLLRPTPTGSAGTSGAFSIHLAYTPDGTTS